MGAIFELLDADNNGVIDAQEFAAWFGTGTRHDKVSRYTTHDTVA